MIEEMVRKMEMTFILYQKTYKSQSLSYRAKFRHFSSLVKPEYLIGRIANRILSFHENRKTRSIGEKIYKALEKSRIREEDIGNRNMFRKKIEEVKDLSHDKQKRIKGYSRKKKNTGEEKRTKKLYETV